MRTEMGRGIPNRMQPSVEIPYLSMKHSASPTGFGSGLGSTMGLGCS